MKIALFEPDIAGNVGTIIRMCACLDLELCIIEPCGFPFDEDKIKRSAMDYINHVKITRYNNFDEFKEQNKQFRIVLLTTKASENYIKFKFKEDDIILAGRESAGVPEYVHNSVDKRIIIPMKNGMRCFNVAMSVAMATGEACRQCNLF